MLILVIVREMTDNLVLDLFEKGLVTSSITLWIAYDHRYEMFGIDAELLIDHAWGYETCRMSDIKNYHSEEHSLSNGQVLMRNYSFDEALVIVREMTDNLVLDLSAILR